MGDESEGFRLLVWVASLLWQRAQQVRDHHDLHQARSSFCLHLTVPVVPLVGVRDLGSWASDRSGSLSGGSGDSEEGGVVLPSEVGRATHNRYLIRHHLGHGQLCSVRSKQNGH